MKKCSNCKELKCISEFYKNSCKNDGLSSYCKKCNTIWVRKRYLRNKKYYDEKNDQSILRNRKYVLEYLKNNPCVDCGESDPVVLEFDHLDEKLLPIATMIQQSYGIERIKIEINKCTVRCANCHRRKTAKDLKWFRYIGE